MTLFTIGFTKSSAKHFFGRLRDPRIRRLVDVRLNNVSQLAGFAKREDLVYFLDALCRLPYEHDLRLAPTREMLDAYKMKKQEPWSEYEKRFNALLQQRNVEDALSRESMNGACLLCSEDAPHHCHRRLVVEYLQAHWGNIEIIHL